MQTASNNKPSYQIEFIADKVKVKTGHRVDNSGEVTFMVGEYMLDNLKDLISITDENLLVTVSKYNNTNND